MQCDEHGKIISNKQKLAFLVSSLLRLDSNQQCTRNRRIEVHAAVYSGGQYDTADHKDQKKNYHRCFA
uniref:Uncharacterized protein n=1 Tax=Oryza sativa subsp. japonica TaxID=39947 RepID=Q60F29_ORYSJ|nr:hypothetical protein [Oryza sativa Japonica Group]